MIVKPSSVKVVERLRIPRIYNSSLLSAKLISLHVFTDTSETAYCIVAYFGIKLEEGVTTCLVSGEQR